MKSSNVLLNGCPDRVLNMGHNDYRSDTLPTELHRNFKYVRSLRLIAKHWSREFREKRTPSRIFMPCNLRSCMVGLGIVISIHSMKRLIPSSKLLAVRVNPFQSRADNTTLKFKTDRLLSNTRLPYFFDSRPLLTIKLCERKKLLLTLWSIRKFTQ